MATGDDVATGDTRSSELTVVLVAGVGTAVGRPVGSGSNTGGVNTGGVIGLRGGLPWRIPEDMKFFRRVTTGTVLVMGRRTFDSIGKPLPGRTNVVVTRDPAPFLAAHPTVIARETIDEALDAARAECVRQGLTTISVIGGGVIYAQALPHADEMLLTHIDYDGAGDVHFPAYDLAQWDVVSREPVGPATAVRYRRRSRTRA